MTSKDGPSQGKHGANGVPTVDGYLRVSTEEQAQDGFGLAAQRAKVVAYAQLYELTLGVIIEDAGASAKSRDRPGLARVLARLDAGESAGVIVAKLDRLTRHLGDWSYLIDHYFSEKAGKQLYSVGDSVNTGTATGRMMLNIIMTIAQWEREIIAERTRDALAEKIRRGERCGKVRYGHDLAGDGRTLVANAAEQEAIGLMRRLRGEGRSLRAIAGALRALGIATKQGNDLWTPDTIAKILKRSA